MAKFKSHEEYDDWRSRRALKRQGAKDLEKIDAERTVYIAETKRSGIGLWGYLVLAVFGIICVLSFTVSGRDLLGRIMALFFRALR